MNSPCQYTVLALNAHGNIVQCRSCEHFRFAYGTSEVCMNEEELKDLSNQLEHEIVRSGLQDQSKKSIRVAVAPAIAALILTPTEACELLLLLHEAKAGLEVNRLLCSL